MAFSAGTYVTEELIRDGILTIGDGYRAKNSELRDAGLPFARAGNINNGFHFEGSDCFPVENIEKVGEKKSHSFDSVFTSKGTVGRIAFVKPGTQEFVYSPQLCYWRSLAPDILDPRFLYYWMNGREFSNQVDYLKGQTDMADYVSLRDQRKMTITIPSFEKQKKLATILGALDDRIELNRQTNQTLEQIAQAIFKSWFVDFEPVKAKQHIRTLGGSDEQTERAAQAVIAGAVNLDVITTTTDLSALDRQLTQALGEKLSHQTEAQRERLAATAQQFPARLVESELGLIPEEWSWIPFGQLLLKTIGGDWGKEKPDTKHTEFVRILRGTDLPKVYAGNDSTVPKRFVELKKLKTRKLIDGDIVIEVSGGSKNQPTGRSLYITNQLLRRLGGAVEPASFCRLFRPINRQTELLLSVHMAKIYDDGKTWSYQNQSTGISNFQTKIFLENEQVLKSSEDLERIFFEQVRPMFNKIYSNESALLEELRNALLPKLLSGELDPSGVCRDTAEVA